MQRSARLTLFVSFLALWSTSEVLAEQAEPWRMTPAPSAATDEFGARVRAYLLAHPEVVMEAAQIFQERQQLAEADATKEAITAHRDQILRDPADPVAGNSKGDVTLVEFFDYNCPYCRKVEPDIMALSAADPGLRVVFKEFPILGPSSDFAARVALSAHRQGKYMPVHQALMRLEPPLTEEKVLQAALKTGVDLARLKRDMTDPALDTQLQRDRSLADALRITGTPAFVLGDALIPGVVDRPTFEALIAKVRKG